MRSNVLRVDSLHQAFESAIYSLKDMPTRRRIFVLHNDLGLNEKTAIGDLWLTEQTLSSWVGTGILSASEQFFHLVGAMRRFRDLTGPWTE